MTPLAYARSLAPVCGPGLVGVYLHGSAALGGFDPATSDVDVLIVVAAPLPDQRAVGERLAAVPGCPGTGVELSVVTAGDVLDCRFEVHVNTVEPVHRVVPGAGHPGDPDLILHTAVCHAHGIAAVGPPPDRVFAPVPRPRLMAALLAELRWAAVHAPTPYAVLNACRAARFAADGSLCSKVAGAEWYLHHHGPTPVVTAALTPADPPSRPATTAFVTHITNTLHPTP